MKNTKTIILLLGILVLIAGLFLVFENDKSPASPEPEASVDTSDWQTYENKSYGFSLKYPDDWRVAEDQTPTNEPIISVYDPEEIASEPPFIHHSEEDHVSAYPQGVPTEGFSGERVSTTVNFSAPVRQAYDYVLSDGSRFATYANLGEVTDGWNEPGFLFAHTAIENLTTECRRDGEVIPARQCDVLTGDTLIRFGDINEAGRAIQIEILESFELLD